MGLATPRSDIASTDGYYDLDDKVTFQATEHQLPLSYVSGDPLQLIPHLGIKDLGNRLPESGRPNDVRAEIVIQLWDASLEEDYDTFLSPNADWPPLPISTSVHSRSLPFGVKSAISLHRPQDKTYITLPFGSYFFKLQSKSSDKEARFYSLVHYSDTTDYGCYSILTEHILRHPRSDEQKDYCRRMLQWLEDKNYISQNLLDECRQHQDTFPVTGLPHPTGRFRIALSTPGSAGEVILVVRMAQAAGKLGWEWVICPGEGQDWKQRNEFLKMLNPHCVVYHQIRHEWFIHGIKNFMSLHWPVGKASGQRERFLNLSRYDGFLLTAPESVGELKNFVCSLGRKFYSVTHYPSACGTTFSSPEPNRLFYCGCNWDNRRNKEYFQLWEQLSNKGYFEAYGHKPAWTNRETCQVLPSWKGQLPFTADAVRRKAYECGISLVIHGRVHLEGNCPSGRIFEAASASSVIISDKLPFTKKYFGDSVLYVDTTKSAEEMFRTIDGHMQRILSHPQEAQELARRSHQIFCEKFALEDFMRDIRDLYESIRLGRAIPGSKVVED
jgi:hypothetical protein